MYTHTQYAEKKHHTQPVAERSVDNNNTERISHSYTETNTKSVARLRYKKVSKD